MRLGDCLDVLATLPESSVDAIVCDPPYGLEFMGKEWDKLGDDAVSKSWDTKGRRENIPSRNPDDPGGRHGTHFKRQNPRCRKCGRAMQGQDTAKGFIVCHCEMPDPYMPNIYPVRMQSWHYSWAVAALRVAKPGCHLLAFGGTRTSHRLACALEDAGWEIRDTLMWVYGSGFPKSHNLKGDHEGWGTALKPAWEPIILARKPLDGTVAENVQRWGCGALNVDGCRIPGSVQSGAGAIGFGSRADNYEKGTGRQYQSKGRWPSNFIHDGSEEVLSLFPETGPSNIRPPTFKDNRGVPGYVIRVLDSQERGHNDNGGSAARFFYCAKASRAEREAGLEGMLERGTRDYRTGNVNSTTVDNRATPDKKARNHHPTVKPVALMRYLCRLVTPPNGLVLDPFMGSGSTGIAARLEGFRFMGIEKDAEYFEIAKRRIAAVEKEHQPDLELRAE